MFQYITDASSLTNSTLPSFNENSISTGDMSQDELDTYIFSTKKHLFYVRENGLFVLRKGSEDLAEVFYNYYQDEMGGF